MIPGESDVYQRMVRRITRFILAFGLLGGVALGITNGMGFGVDAQPPIHHPPRGGKHRGGAAVGEELAVDHTGHVR